MTDKWIPTQTLAIQTMEIIIQQMNLMGNALAQIAASKSIEEAKAIADGAAKEYSDLEDKVREIRVSFPPKKL